MSKGKFTVGALFGVVVGAVAGVLMAPKKGEDTRNDLKQKANKLKSETGEKYHDANEEVGEKAAQAKEQAQDTVEAAKEKTHELKVRSENALEGAKKGFKKAPKE